MQKHLFNKSNNSAVIADFSILDDGFNFDTNIDEALNGASNKLTEIDELINETEKTIKNLTPECDKLDYILSASSGVLCGIIDIFLVGKPGESPVGDVNDKWFDDRVKDFAKLCGWNTKKNSSVKSAIGFLERKFKVPYDQRGAGDAASFIFDLKPANHHFKSLAHNPTLLGLFFSILDQFTNSSHFVTNGQLIALENADRKFELRGKSTPAKLFAGIINWFGHLMSDVDGSSGSKGRGSGIPSPIWCWVNDVITLKNKLKIPVSKFDKDFCDLALEIYTKGYDVRFQVTQAIPVFINELLVRTFYSVRRMIRYLADTKQEVRSFAVLWKNCEPFTNATVKRMLTVAHGTFVIVDAGDATVKAFIAGGGKFNPVEFFLRLNIVGVGRFTISMYGETRRGLKKITLKGNAYLLRRERTLLVDYIDGLNILSNAYNDKELLLFIDNFKTSDLYKEAFDKSAKLAELRNVPKDKILYSKIDIDSYFKEVE